jgi:hypothetical protein
MGVGRAPPRNPGGRGLRVATTSRRRPADDTQVQQVSLEVWGDADFSQDFIGVLAQKWGRPAHLHGGGREFDGAGHQFKRVCVTVCKRCRHFACGSANTSVRSLIGPQGTLAASSAASQSAGCAGIRRCASSGTSVSRWRTRLALRAKAFVGGQLGPAGDLAELGKLPVVAHSQDEVAVGHFEHLVGHDVLVRVAHAPGALR